MQSNKKLMKNLNNYDSFIIKILIYSFDLFFFKLIQNIYHHNIIFNFKGQLKFTIIYIFLFYLI